MKSMKFKSDLHHEMVKLPRISYFVCDDITGFPCRVAFEDGYSLPDMNTDEPRVFYLDKIENNTFVLRSGTTVFCTIVGKLTSDNLFIQITGTVDILSDTSNTTVRLVGVRPLTYSELCSRQRIL